MALLEKATQIATLFQLTDDRVRKCVAAFREANLRREMGTLHHSNPMQPGAAVACMAISLLTVTDPLKARGLGMKTASMCQIPTYITRVAHGTEKGFSLAVDLGGTNLRVCSVDFHGNAKLDVQQSKVAVPQDLMVATQAESLFRFIALQIQKFVNVHHMNRVSQLQRDPFSCSFSLGLTFSFPVYQSGIDSGILLRWTKGFNIPTVVGSDVCALLQTQIDVLHLPIRVTALVNDAVGTIMSRAYTLPERKTRTSIGAIFRAGTNGVYLEKLSKIVKPLDGNYDASTGEMFVSTEWGSFDNGLSVLPNTMYDEQLDRMSVNPGDQMFEKRVSGMFLGELLRTVMLEMHRDSTVQLFNSYRAPMHADGKQESPLYSYWTLDSSVLSIAAADSSNDLAKLRSKLAESLDMRDGTITIIEAQAVKIVANAIGRRAARLAGMAIGAVILHTERFHGSIDPLTAGNRTLQSLTRFSTANHGKAVTSEPLAKAQSVACLQDDPGHVSANNLFVSNPSNEHDIVDIGIDGSLAEHYPCFEDHLRDALRVIDGIGEVGEARVRIGIAKDGSSVGAAIIALLAAMEA
ncbi:MAG: glucokinase [Chrysothrix sp. TS-e1954]|nr:MAG: glucokinase [Chrysothrix sp. TS-e1954]